MSDMPPNVPVEPVRRSLIERISIVWVIPALALIIALGVAWQSYQSRGPVIEIAFDNASGVVANETELRYRDVAVGLVERVTFTESLDKVLVRVRLDQNVSDYVDEEAQFWVVRPKISTEGIEGLDTVLTGVFIEGLWDTVPGTQIGRFDGLSEAPLSRDGREGLRIRLRATSDTGLTENAPIVYRGIEVGRIGRAEVSDDGSTVEAEAMIFEPHDRLVSDATRFWDTSGFSFSLGPNGAEINFSSIASLISGGITFSTIVSGGRPVEEGAVFSVYYDEGSARASVFAAESGETLTLSVVFEDNVAGLAVDSPVDLGGVRVGRVTSVNGLVDEERYGDRKVRLAATIAIQPGRLGLADEDLEPGAALAFLDRLVQDGLRARLVTASILTGGLKVQLIDVPEAEQASIDVDSGPNPELPTTESDIADVTATAEGVFERINSLPIEELMTSAIGTLDNISRFIGNDDLRQMPGDIRGLVGDARGLIGSDAAQALPEELSAAATELRLLVQRLNEGEAATRLLDAVDAVSEAGQAASGALEGVPALVERLEAVAAKAEALPLEDLVSEVSAVAASANALIGSEAAQALPATANAALNDLSESAGRALDRLDAVLNDVRERELVAAAEQALSAIGDTAGSVTDAVAGVPALVERLEAVATKAEALPLEDLVAEVTAVAANANAVLDSEAARNLPGAVISALDELRASANDTLAELSAVLTQVREEELAAAASEALNSIGRAAEDVSASVEGVPALVERIDAVAAKAQEVPLDELAADLSALLESADALIGTDAARKLPADLSAALDSLRQVLDDLREGGVIENANRTFASARNAADSIATAADSLPSLVRRAQSVLMQAAETLRGYDANRGVGRDAAQALREVERAAAAVSSLARALERNPNSLLFGR
ncbi:MAG: MlaD family protein [Pseudooceanicola sp.]